MNCCLEWLVEKSLDGTDEAPAATALHVVQAQQLPREKHCREHVKLKGRR